MFEISKNVTTDVLILNVIFKFRGLNKYIFDFEFSFISYKKLNKLCELEEFRLQLNKYLKIAK